MGLLLLHSLAGSLLGSFLLFASGFLGGLTGFLLSLLTATFLTLALLNLFLLGHNGRNVHLLLGLNPVGSRRSGSILALVVEESLVDAQPHLTDTVLRVQEAFFIAGRDEAQFYQTAGHRRFAQHQESGLLDTFVDASSLSTGTTLDEFGQFDALCHILVLDELEHDIALGGVGVETLIALLIVLLIEDNLVLSLSDGEVVGCTVHTQRIGLHAS